MINGYVFYRGPSMLDGQPIVAIITGLNNPSRNEKTGQMLQTYILRADMHPVEAVRAGEDVSICGDCPHRGDGAGAGRSCYVVVAQGPSAMWRALNNGSYPSILPEDLGRKISDRMVRVGTYGDPAAVPLEVWEYVLWHAKGFTAYTHQWKRIDPRWARIAMASADSPEDAWVAQAAGWRTFRVGAGRETGEVICPASAEAGKKAQCIDCRACMGTTAKARASIAIAPHGNGARYARERATAERELEMV